MDELLQKALDQREQLRAELEAVDRFIAAYTRLKERSALVAPAPLFDTPPTPAPLSKADRAAAVKAMMKAAAKHILDEGRPLTRSELVERLSADGHQLEGGDKSKVLGTNLWRSGMFLSLKGAGYWPKGAPVPQRFASFERRNSMID